MPAELTEPAFAKVNLFLHVLGRRADGYHLLDSLVVFADVGDVLSIADADGLSLTVEGPFAAGLASEPDNLVLRAARALAAEAGVVRPRVASCCTRTCRSRPASAAVRPTPPRRCGCCAGSGRSRPTVLARLAAGLGADVPVCLASRASRMGGIGERLSPAPALPDCGIVLVEPGGRGGDGRGVPRPPRHVVRARGPAARLAGRRRDGSRSRGAAATTWQRAAVALQPVIDDVLAALAGAPGCLLARMSGSGATCFGLFATVPPPCAAEALRRPGWWSWGGRLPPRILPSGRVAEPTLSRETREGLAMRGSYPAPGDHCAPSIRRRTVTS